MQVKGLLSLLKLTHLNLLLVAMLIATSLATPLPVLAQGAAEPDNAGQIFLPFVSSNQDSQSPIVPEIPNTAEVSAAVVNGKLVNQEPSWIVFAPNNCTAVLVHPQWIMSAGHCNKPDLLEAGTEVYIGGHPDKNGVKARILKSFVLGWTPHERDFALFKLDRSVKKKPIKMARNDVVDYGTKVIVYGYGLQSSDAFATPDGRLYKTDKLSVTHPDKLIYRQTESGSHLCDGDSGSPVVRARSKLLVGINTGFSGTTCANASEAVGAKLFDHIDWVDKTVNENGGPGNPNALHNIALGKEARASSDVEYEAAPKAVDGDTVSRWKSEDDSGNTEQWIQVDLGQPYVINRVVLQWAGPDFGTAYKIQVSKNGRKWRAIRRVWDGDGDTDELTNLSGTGRYIRLFSTRSNTNVRYALIEFEVYGRAK